MTDDRHISQEELTLHAMQALTSEESAAVRLHLSECAECRKELAEVSGDLALVAMSVDQHEVPEGARQRFIDRIATASPGPEQPARAPVVPITLQKRTSRPASWIPWAAVAAMLIVSVALGVTISVLNQQLQTEDALLRREERLIQARNAENLKASALLDVLTAPGAQRVLLTAGKTPPAPSARAVYLASRGALVLQASNMQPLPENKTYELWVIPTSGAPVPAGLFRPDSAGSASIVLPAIPRGVQAKAFGITIENAGGSNTPTAPIILSGAAPAAGE
jgi:heme exporter protein D